MKTYNKLVRDKIPEIIVAENKIPKTRILGDEEYKKELLRKLLEESNEVFEARNNEQDLSKEIGDVLEVIDSVIKAFKLDKNQILNLKSKRKEG